MREYGKCGTHLGCLGGVLSLYDLLLQSKPKANHLQLASTTAGVAPFIPRGPPDKDWAGTAPPGCTRPLWAHLRPILFKVVH
jgi:hypothetical protein